MYLGLVWFQGKLRNATLQYMSDTISVWFGFQRRFDMLHYYLQFRQQIHKNVETDTAALRHPPLPIKLDCPRSRISLTLTRQTIGTTPGRLEMQCHYGLNGGA